MPLALLTRLPWKWLGIALAAIAMVALLYKAPWAEARGRAAVNAKYQPVMARALATMNLTAERIRRARAAALANDLANARRVETAQANITQETSYELQGQLAAARAAASDLARRLRASSGAQAAGGGGRAAGDASASNAPGAAAGAGSVPVVDENDLLICSENTVRAQGWLAWWKRISAIPR